MKTIGYIRVSTNTQDVKNQRHEILEFAHKLKVKINEFIEVEESSRKSQGKRRITEAFDKLQSGDMLIVSELSRLGRSTGEVINLVNALAEKKVRLISIKQNLDLTGKNDITSKVMVTMFSLFSELERDMISQRTKNALAAKKEAGVILGRPTGSQSPNKLDDKKEEILKLLNMDIPKATIAKLVGSKRATLNYYLTTRKIKKTNEKSR